MCPLALMRSRRLRLASQWTERVQHDLVCAMHARLLQYQPTLKDIPTGCHPRSVKPMFQFRILFSSTRSSSGMEQSKLPEDRLRSRLHKAVCSGWASAVGVLCMAMLLTGVSRAEEPYQRFLEKLKSERLFDLALVYLDDLEDEPGVTDEFKSVIALERGMLLYSAASQMAAQNAQRPIKLDQAEQAIRNFLKTRQEHPRRGEAQLTLGNLLLTRAEEAKEKAGKEIKQDVRTRSSSFLKLMICSKRQ